MRTVRHIHAIADPPENAARVHLAVAFLEHSAPYEHNPGRTRLSPSHSGTRRSAHLRLREAIRSRAIHNPQEGLPC
jgi:hypothetical protein